MPGTRQLVHCGVQQLSRPLHAPGNRTPDAYDPQPDMIILTLNSSRCWRARCKADELRTEGLRKLQELEKLEQERAARRLELRRAGLSVFVSRGAGLRGEPSEATDCDLLLGRPAVFEFRAVLCFFRVGGRLIGSARVLYCHEEK